MSTWNVPQSVQNAEWRSEALGNGKVICASIYCGPKYDFGNGPRIWIDNLDQAQGTLQYFKEYLEDPSIKKVFHNYSFDYHELGNEGITVQGFSCDTMHMARLWESSRVGKGSYSLESLSEELYIRKRPYKEIFGKPHIKRDGMQGKTIDVPPVIVASSPPYSDPQELQRGAETRSAWIEYSAFDAEATWHVRKELESLLREMFWTSESVQGALHELSMWDFYRRYYRDFGQLLVNMERRGIHVTVAKGCEIGRRRAPPPRNRARSARRARKGAQPVPLLGGRRGRQRSALHERPQHRADPAAALRPRFPRFRPLTRSAREKGARGAPAGAGVFGGEHDGVRGTGEEKAAEDAHDFDSRTGDSANQLHGKGAAAVQRGDDSGAGGEDRRGERRQERVWEGV